MSDHPLPERLRAALTDAMRRRDRPTASVLRTVLGALANAEAVDRSQAPAAQPGRIAGGVAGLGAAEVPRRILSPAEVEDIVRSEAAERRRSADEYDHLGRGTEAERLRSEAAVIEAHLA